MDAPYWFDLSKMVENGQVVEPERIIEPSIWSWLELRSASKGSESRDDGVSTSTSLVGRRVS